MTTEFFKKANEILDSLSDEELIEKLREAGFNVEPKIKCDFQRKIEVGNPEEELEP